MAISTSPVTSYMETHVKLTGTPLMQLAFFKPGPHVHFLLLSLLTVAFHILKAPCLMMPCISFVYTFIKRFKGNLTANSL